MIMKSLGEKSGFATIFVEKQGDGSALKSRRKSGIGVQNTPRLGINGKILMFFRLFEGIFL